MENKPASSLVESLGLGTLRDAPAFMWKTGGPDALNDPQQAMANHCGILPRKLHEPKIHEHSS